MRKAFLAVVAVIVVIVLNSCIKEYVTKETHIHQGAEISTYYVDVYPNQWNWTGEFGREGYYCFAEKNLAAISSSVIESGAVLVYAIFGDYDHQLPYVVPFHDSGFFVRTIRYDLQPGQIGFVVEDSDFRTPYPPFSNMVKFKVVVIAKK